VDGDFSQTFNMSQINRGELGVYYKMGFEYQDPNVVPLHFFSGNMRVEAGTFSIPPATDVYLPTLRVNGVDLYHGIAPLTSGDGWVFNNSGGRLAGFGASGFYLPLDTGNGLGFTSGIYGLDYAPTLAVAWRYNSTGVMQVSTDAANHFAGTGIRLGGQLVSELPTCDTDNLGTRATVTDATVATFHAPLVGGGSVVTTGFCDGSAWVVGG
jgi:hypothetical protein